MPSRRTNFPWKWAWPRSRDPYNFGSTVGYPSDSLASCYAFSARQHMLSALFAITRPSVSMSSAVTGGSVKSGWSYDYPIFTAQYRHPSSFRGISFIYKFYRILPDRGRQTKVGWENKLFSSFMHKCLENRIRGSLKLLLVTNRKLHMHFRLAPTLMTLDDFELLWVRISSEFRVILQILGGNNG